MPEPQRPPSQAHQPIPADDLTRKLSVSDPDDPSLPHVAVVGDTYTVLLSGAQTNGKYCLIDMTVPHCGGPGPHRHDFEEVFHLLEGEIEFTFRGEKTVVKAGTTVNIPANAPHFVTNMGKRKAHECFAYARQPGWKRSCLRSASRSIAALRPRLSQRLRSRKSL